MPSAKVRAFTILGEFDQAQTELVGKAMILTDGKAGTVERVWLDENARPANLDQGPRREVACLNHQILGGLLNSPSGRLRQPAGVNRAGSTHTNRFVS
jgi:hypothetical protein